MEISKKNNLKILFFFVICVLSTVVFLNTYDKGYSGLLIIVVAICLLCLIDRAPFIKTNGFYLFCSSLAFLFYLLIDKALVDHFIFIFFTCSILADFLYKFSKSIQAKILKKKYYQHRQIVYFMYPLLLFVLLFQVQQNDSDKLQNNLIPIFIESTKTCHKRECYKSKDITQGVTTFRLRVKVANGCMEISSYTPIPSVKPIKECNLE